MMLGNHALAFSLSFTDSNFSLHQASQHTQDFSMPSNRFQARKLGSTKTLTFGFETELVSFYLFSRKISEWQI
jgi:hypothetical protein